MKILIYEPINQTKQLILNTLIKGGFHVIAVDMKEKIIPEILKSEYNILIGDFSDREPGHLKIIQTLKSDPKTSKVKIILHSNNPQKEYLVKLVQLGIVGVIFKPFVLKNFLPNLLAILKKNDVKIEERRHVRVKPAITDKTSIILRSPNTMRMITGKIIDISMGGIAFEVFGDLADNDLRPRQIIKSVQVKLGMSTISTSSLIIAQKTKFFGLKFLELNEFDSNVLSQYIYKRLYEDRLVKEN